jgi:dienelactone hydrolase
MKRGWDEGGHMLGERIVYQADGLEMHGHLYLSGSGGTAPGILLFPEIFGPGEHSESRAVRLAELGYHVLVGDVHGEGRVIKALDEVMPISASLREDALKIRARTDPALAVLRARAEVDSARIAAIGYCFGGTMALELARGGAPIKGVVGFHSGLGTKRPEDARNIKGKILACIGADDPGIPPEQRAAFENEMRAAGVDWRLHLYGGVVHSFTNPAADALGRPDFARYDARADDRSWREMIDFFDEIFGE